MVSMMNKSAPAASAARTCSANSSYASSKGIVPSGSSSAPVGPISAATYFAPDALPHAMAAANTSATLAASPSLRRFAPKVLALTTSLPASTYWAWMPVISSGFVRHKSSGSSPASSPACCSMVPIAPSNTKKRSPRSTAAMVSSQRTTRIARVGLSLIGVITRPPSK